MTMPSACHGGGDDPRHLDRQPSDPAQIEEEVELRVSEHLYESAEREPILVVGVRGFEWRCWIAHDGVSTRWYSVDMVSPRSSDQISEGDVYPDDPNVLRRRLTRPHPSTHGDFLCDDGAIDGTDCWVGFECEELVVSESVDSTLFDGHG